MSFEENAIQWYMTGKTINNRVRITATAETKTLEGWRLLLSPLKPNPGLNGPPEAFRGHEKQLTTE
jgi:hypothetical protein